MTLGDRGHLARIETHIRPLQVCKGGRRPVTVGTALLVEAHGAYFAITAKHVLENGPNLTFFHDGTKERIFLQGERWISNESTPEMAAWKLDLGTVRLAGPILPPYKDWQPVPISALRSFVTEPPPFPYTVMGFPSSKNRSNPNRDVMRQNANCVYGLQLAEMPQCSPRLQFGAQSHLMLQFDRKAVLRDGEPWEFPDPHGVSGAPIWYEDEKGLCVVAIAIEYYAQEKILVATDIAYVLKQIDDAEQFHRSHSP